MKTLNIALWFILFSFQLFAQSEWFWQNPLPQGNDLSSVSFIDEFTGYAVGDAGTIIKTTDGGDSWIIQSSGITNKYITGVSFATAEIGIATTYSEILITSDGGNNWLFINLGINEYYEDVEMIDANTGTIVGGYHDFSTILRTTDGGNTWIRQTAGTDRWLYGVSFIDANHGTAVGRWGKIIRTTNGGETWIEQVSGITNDLVDVSFIDSNNGMIVGGGTVLRTTNGGNLWFTQLTTTHLESVSFINLTVAYVVGLHGNIYKTTNGGVTWITQTSGTNYYLKGVSFTDENNGIAVGGPAIVKTTDGGDNWFNQTESVTTNNLWAVDFVNNQVGTAVGISATILRTDNGGETWVSQSSGTTNNLTDVSFIDSDNGLAVGNSTILKTTNGGSTWILTGSHFLEGVSLMGGGIGYGVGYGGSIFKTTDGGSSWIQQSSGTNYWLYGVSFIDSLTGMVVGYVHNYPYVNMIILKTTDGGNNWITKAGGLGILFNVSFNDENNAIAVGGNHVWKTTDGGENWVYQLITGSNMLVGVSFSDINNGTIVGYGGAIFTTIDGGINWTPQFSGTRNDLFGVSSIDENNIVAVGYGGTILRTTNGGIPVELTSFIATANQNSVLLEWTTATEINNQGFEIERKSSESEFEKIGYTAGSGTTTEPNEYSFTDNNVLSGTYTYRLKQVDFDGSFEYSEEIEVKVSVLLGFSLQQNYPNPFNPSTMIRYEIPGQARNDNILAVLKVYDVLGNEIATLVNEEKPAGEYEVEFNSRGLTRLPDGQVHQTLPSGIYFYQLRAGSFIQTKKMLMLK